MTVGAVVFDFNGTLSDDEPVLLTVYQELFAELGRPLSEREYLDELAGHTDEEMLRRWFGRSDPAAIEQRVARYCALVADGSTVSATMRDAVRYAAGRVPVALVTSAVREEVDTVLEATDLRDAFDAVVSLEDVERAKPAPDCYFHAASLLGVEPAALLVFEDTEAGVAAARAAGAHVVGLTRTLGAERLAGADELVDRIDRVLLERLLG
jgi:beta-phosphoglucomutase